MALQNSVQLPLEYLIRPGTGEKGPYPCLFMLHGYGSNEADLFSFAAELPQELCIISLRAPYDLQPFGHAWYAINFESSQGKWNDVPQAVESRDLVLNTIDLAIAGYDLDPERISLLGFSQGSILSYSLALSYPDRVKSLIALSGYIDPEMLVKGFTSGDLTQLQIYASHGQVDPIIPSAWAQESVAFLKSHGITVTYEEYPVGHGVSAANLSSFKRWMADKY
ncbi:alpha/beta hydrolase [Robiginitalea aurantiaca]|uniref:Alpha/beta hydrolase-fold protein n=1 Tax=Robiginitalea aurantiaca TaxID=3056915 RepID=A0ABT7WFZ4_9FLAO|nr:alpha/beta hydrolase-fold protein [Robiginitalea aurantiaca]MDM9631847.1 alpha/beta hydrolase-fold protein [Robiginitalea aurantiaca]